MSNPTYNDIKYYNSQSDRLSELLNQKPLNPCLDGCNNVNVPVSNKNYVNNKTTSIKQTNNADSSSEYLSNLSGKVITCKDDKSGKNCSNWHNQSDRTNAHEVKINIPRYGNSTKMTLTANRPGAMSAPGIGVDIKNGNYNRYLAKKKVNK
tara:strand:+ start:635 stop:1087 length:453 start_codon:yes stop_codon:yes gene_type:complete